MISKWGVKNFKSILEADLDLAPLTIFTGVNSSGKSSFLHSIAMLKQSVDSDKKDGYVLTGNLVGLGDFEHIYCKKAAKHKQDTKEIDIQFSISTENHKSIHVEQKLKMDDEAKVCLDSFTMESKTNNNDDIFLKYSKDGITKTDGLSFDEIKQYKQLPSSLRKDISFDKMLTNFRNSFIPDKISFFSKITDEQINEFINNLTDLSTEEDHLKYLEYCVTREEGEDDSYDCYYLRKYVFSENHCFVDEIIFHKLYLAISKGTKSNCPDPFTPIFKKYFHENNSLSLFDWYFTLFQRNKKEQKIIIEKITKEGFTFIKQLVGNDDYITPDFELPDRIKEVCKELDEYFKYKIKYLGPLRMDPRWSEGLNLNSDIDVKGSNSISYFHRYQEKSISNISPKSFDSLDFFIKTTNLNEALNEWLSYIGIANEHIIINGDDKAKIEIFAKELSFLNKDGFLLMLHFDGDNYAIPQLGTGVSQILPILIMCLTAPLDSTIVIQEPEQALHPKMQSRLADFFIAMALSGRQCIIETHSEYIIEQLRYRIIMLSDRKFDISPEHEPKPLHKHIKLYFVTKNEGCSHFKDIVIDENASLDEMPDDFFDESHKIIRKMMDEVAKKEKMDKEND